MLRPASHGDLLGREFGRWTVISGPENSGKDVVWQCRCACGEVRYATASNLVLGKSKSCGCGITGKKGTRSLGRTTEFLGMKWHYRKYLRQSARVGRAFDLGVEEFSSMAKSDCFYCGAPPAVTCFKRRGKPAGFVANGIDRVDQSAGYIDGNCVPCCWRCNWGKGSGSQQDFLEMCKAVAAHQDYKSIDLVEMARLRMEAA